MPDEIKPDESSEEQMQPEGDAVANAVAEDNAESDAADEQQDNPEAAENNQAENAAGESPDGQEAEAGGDDLEATMMKMLEEDSDTPVDGTSQPQQEDEFPDLSQVKMEQQVANPAEFQQLSPAPAPTATANNIDLLLDVKMPVSIELGRTDMPISEILTLGPGSVVELDKLAGEPVDLLVNDKIIARGEVVVVDENFGVRITMLMSPEERLKSLAQQ